MYGVISSSFAESLYDAWSLYGEATYEIEPLISAMEENGDLAFSFPNKDNCPS